MGEFFLLYNYPDTGFGWIKVLGKDFEIWDYGLFEWGGVVFRDYYPSALRSDPPHCSYTEQWVQFFSNSKSAIRETKASLNILLSYSTPNDFSCEFLEIHVNVFFLEIVGVHFHAKLEGRSMSNFASFSHKTADKFY